MPECPGCGDERSCANDVLQCIVYNHDADMGLWRTFKHRQDEGYD